jgi:hypothetical protein
MPEVAELEARIAELEGQLANVQKGPQWRALEQKVSAADAETARYKGLFEGAREQLVSTVAQAAGFKPNDDGKFDGAVGRVLDLFKGTLGEEDLPTATSFVDLAKEFNLTTTPGEKPEGDTPPANAVAALLTAVQGPGAALAAAGLAPAAPGTVEELDARIAAAEKAGDVGTSIALKQQKAYAGAPSA